MRQQVVVLGLNNQPYARALRQAVLDLNTRVGVTMRPMAVIVVHEDEQGHQVVDTSNSAMAREARQLIQEGVMESGPWKVAVQHEANCVTQLHRHMARGERLNCYCTNPKVVVSEPTS